MLTKTMDNANGRFWIGRRIAGVVKSNFFCLSLNLLFVDGIVLLGELPKKFVLDDHKIN